MQVVRLPARSRGFTLLDLLTTLTVSLVLVGVGIPSWQAMVESNAIGSARSQMTAILALGRLTAVKYNQATTLCPTLDGESCSGDYTAWHQGYMLFLDDDRDRQLDAGETVLRRLQGASRGVRIVSSSGRRSIRFDADGSAWGSNLTLRFCGQSGDRTNKGIVLYGTGRTRLSDTLTDGSAIRC